MREFARAENKTILEYCETQRKQNIPQVGADLWTYEGNKKAISPPCTLFALVWGCAPLMEAQYIVRSMCTPLTEHYQVHS
jgi:hypothetical protein